jgi:glutamate 5-kinase
MPSTALRNDVLAKAKRIVVKVGSQLLTDPAGGVDTAFMRRIASQIAQLKAAGKDVTLVSSGSIAVGRQKLDMPKRPKSVGVLQAVAAVGQSGLMSQWVACFAKHDLNVAQMLVTRGDFEDRKRYLNIRNCLTELHNIHAIPIINENDTVSVEELSLGDNDVLAAMVTNALPADALIILTTVDGLYDHDGAVVEIVHDLKAAAAYIGDHKSDMGTGGMHTKIEAARMVTGAGEVAAIANGRAKNILTKLFDGAKEGTVFVPAQQKRTAKLRWISDAVRPAGAIAIDAGAAKALVTHKKSLLATGITKVTGRFEKGDVIKIVTDEDHKTEIARGIINYDAAETKIVMGKRSNQFQKLLGRSAYDVVVHRDNLVITHKN